MKYYAGKDLDFRIVKDTQGAVPSVQGRAYTMTLRAKMEEAKRLLLDGRTDLTASKAKEMLRTYFGNVRLLNDKTIYNYLTAYRNGSVASGKRAALLAEVQRLRAENETISGMLRQIDNLREEVLAASEESPVHRLDRETEEGGGDPRDGGGALLKAVEKEQENAARQHEELSKDDTMLDTQRGALLKTLADYAAMRRKQAEALRAAGVTESTPSAWQEEQSAAQEEQLEREAEAEAQAQAQRSAEWAQAEADGYANELAQLEDITEAELVAYQTELARLRKQGADVSEGMQVLNGMAWMVARQQFADTKQRLDWLSAMIERAADDGDSASRNYFKAIFDDQMRIIGATGAQSAESAASADAGSVEAASDARTASAPERQSEAPAGPSEEQRAEVRREVERIPGSYALKEQLGEAMQGGDYLPDRLEAMEFADDTDALETPELLSRPRSRTDLRELSAEAGGVFEQIDKTQAKIDRLTTERDNVMAEYNAMPRENEAEKYDLFVRWSDLTKQRAELIGQRNEARTQARALALQIAQNELLRNGIERGSILKFDPQTRPSPQTVKQLFATGQPIGETLRSGVRKHGMLRDGSMTALTGEETAQLFSEAVPEEQLRQNRAMARSAKMAARHYGAAKLRLDYEIALLNRMLGTEPINILEAQQAIIDSYTAKTDARPGSVEWKRWRERGEAQVALYERLHQQAVEGMDNDQLLERSHKLYTDRDTVETAAQNCQAVADQLYKHSAMSAAEALSGERGGALPVQYVLGGGALLQERRRRRGGVQRCIRRPGDGSGREDAARFRRLHAAGYGRGPDQGEQQRGVRPAGGQHPRR